MDRCDRDRWWDHRLALFCSAELRSIGVGNRRLGHHCLAWGPCDPVLACSSINIECNVATFHMEFVQRLAGVKSPLDFVEIFNDHSRRLLATLAEQAKELAALVQEIAGSAAEPLKTGFEKVTRVANYQG